MMSSFFKFGPENVYSEWGGTKPMPENPNAYLTPGGPVPKELWYIANSLMMIRKKLGMMPKVTLLKEN